MLFSEANGLKDRNDKISSNAMADHHVTSGKDPLIAHLNDLSSPAGRKSRGQFLAESTLLVQRALEDQLPIDCILYTSDLLKTEGGQAMLAQARSRGIRCATASGGLLAKVTSSRPVPEVCAIVGIAYPEATVNPECRLILIAENINNPDNLGMILRTADAGGADIAVIAGADPLHKNCVRAARGAVGRMPMAYTADLAGYVAQLKQNGWIVLGTALDADSGLYELELPEGSRVAVIVGNENSGVTRPVLDACTWRILIPMAHGQDSLNVGVSAGVMLYELYRCGVGGRIGR